MDSKENGSARCGDARPAYPCLRLPAPFQSGAMRHNLKQQRRHSPFPIGQVIGGACSDWSVWKGTRGDRGKKERKKKSQHRHQRPYCMCTWPGKQREGDATGLANTCESHALPRWSHHDDCNLKHASKPSYPAQRCRITNAAPTNESTWRVLQSGKDRDQGASRLEALRESRLADATCTWTCISMGRCGTACISHVEPRLACPCPCPCVWVWGWGWGREWPGSAMMPCCHSAREPCATLIITRPCSDDQTSTSTRASISPPLAHLQQQATGTSLGCHHVGACGAERWLNLSSRIASQTELVLESRMCMFSPIPRLGLGPRHARRRDDLWFRKAAASRERRAAGYGYMDWPFFYRLASSTGLGLHMAFDPCNHHSHVTPSPPC